MRPGLKLFLLMAALVFAFAGLSTFSRRSVQKDETREVSAGCCVKATIPVR